MYMHMQKSNNNIYFKCYNNTYMYVLLLMFIYLNFNREKFIPFA